MTANAEHARAGAQGARRRLGHRHRRGRRSDDSWARDTAPTFVVDGRGGLAGVDWRFNAYGGIYEEYARTANMARRILDLLGARRFAAPLVLEGGAVHTDGDGTLLTTEDVVLDPRRNPGLPRGGRAPAVRLPRRGRVVWLSGALEHDNTGGPRRQPRRVRRARRRGGHGMRGPRTTRRPRPSRRTWRGSAGARRARAEPRGGRAAVTRAARVPRPAALAVVRELLPGRRRRPAARLRRPGGRGRARHPGAAPSASRASCSCPRWSSRRPTATSTASRSSSRRADGRRGGLAAGRGAGRARRGRYSCRGGFSQIPV